MAITADIEDRVRELFGQPPEDVEQLETAMAHVSKVFEGIRDELHKFADAMSETKLDPKYAEAVHEAAAGAGAQGQQLDEAMGSDTIMQR